MKRQRGRSRPGGNTGGGGGGNKPPQNANRAFESNGPDGVKIRGHAQHVFEKYQQLARDASSAGDRVLAENYLQHAEHYFRVLRAVQPHRTAAEILGRDSIASGFDIDFEDETGEEQGEAPEAEGEDQRQAYAPEQRLEQRSEQRQDQPRGDQQRQDQPRRDRDRPYGRDRNDRQQDRQPDRQPDQRQSEPRSDGERIQPERVQGERQERPERRERAPRPYRDDRRERFEPRDQGEERVDPLAVVEPQSTPLTQVVSEPQSSPMLRSQDGSTSHAPAFLQQQPRAEVAEVAEEAPAPKVRRRRAPRTFEGAEPVVVSEGSEEA